MWQHDNVIIAHFFIKKEFELWQQLENMDEIGRQSYELKVSVNRSHMDKIRELEAFLLPRFF
jgi:hypothetical protein